MKILVQGDSHVRYFRQAFSSKRLQHHTVNFQEIGGATATGLDNPNSKTHSLNEFRAGLQKYSPNVLITHLGEVDCGFVIWYWVQKGKRTIDEQIDHSINSYIAYLKEAKERVKRIIVTSPTLPSIRDGDQHKVSRLRKEITATLKQRTLLTLQYSNKLQSHVEREEGMTYIDCTTELLNGSGVLSTKYLNTKKEIDHHLDMSIMGSLWGDKLINVL